MSDIFIEKICCDELKPYAKNSRKHSAEQVKQIVNSIEEFGFTNPILIHRDNQIIAGHGRLEAAKKLGFVSVPCIRLDELTEEQARALVIADNKIALNADWDFEILAEELNALQELDVDLSVLGFDEEELNKLLEVDRVDGLTDEDAVPDVPAEPKTKLGDVWMCGNHRVMCGDSTSIDAVDILTAQTSVDMVFTDPPYGMSYGDGRAEGESDGTVKGFGVIKGDEKRGEDLVELIRSSLAAALTKTKPGASLYVCFPWRTYSEFEKALPFPPRACIVWDKKSIGIGANKGYRPQHEFIFYLAGDSWYGDRSQSDVWSMTRGSTQAYVHPTQKPVELIETALKNSSKSGGAVLDLFGGSGSTLIASEKNNRVSYTMELDPKYCDVIVKRWQDFTGKKAILESTGEEF